MCGTEGVAEGQWLQRRVGHVRWVRRDASSALRKQHRWPSLSSDQRPAVGRSGTDSLCQRLQVLGAILGSPLPLSHATPHSLAQPTSGLLFPLPCIPVLS